MSSDVHASNRILAGLGTADGIGVVRMEVRVASGIDDVWSALTDPAPLAQWLGEIEGDLRVGGEFRAHFLASGWRGTGRIDICEPPRHLLVLTRDEDDPGAAYDHAIEVQLATDGGETAIVWEERGIPEDLLAAYGAGIQVHVEDLTAHLAGGGRCDAQARFEELFPGYRDLSA
jgi:uncharacterized protein YndB with AHSA1/START domain